MSYTIRHKILKGNGTVLLKTNKAYDDHDMSKYSPHPQK